MRQPAQNISTSPKCNASTIKAEKLETVIWEKFCEVIKDPLLVTEQITKLKEDEMKKTRGIHAEIDSMDRRLKNLTISENRLLDAYREGVISMEQLRDQIVKVQETKKHLQQERQVLIERKSYSPGVIKKSVHEHCYLINERLDSLKKDDFHSKKYLLLLAIDRIVLEGKTARIKYVIPVQEQTASVTFHK